MSRLDSFIRRLEAQRASLNYLVAEIDGREGLVLELGLGNGRTYDHLRELCPGRGIFVFERRLAAHPASRPDDEHLILGDLAETLPKFAEMHGGKAVLIHADVGSGDENHNRAMASLLSWALSPLLAESALVACDQPLSSGELVELALPPQVPTNRYHLYQKQS